MTEAVWTAAEKRSKLRHLSAEVPETAVAGASRAASPPALQERDIWLIWTPRRKLDGTRHRTTQHDESEVERACARTRGRNPHDRDDQR
jgi:hypothetical protein